MRLLRSVCCALLLATVAAAQSIPSSLSQPMPGDPGQSTAQPAQGAQQNPLDTKPQTPEQQDQQQQQQQQKQPSAFEQGTSGLSDQDQSLGEIHLMTRYTEINGNQTRSFRVPGENNLGEFNYYFDHRFLSGVHRMQFLTMYRATDDSSIDPDRNSLQKAYFRIYSPRDEYIFGDALVNYSRLSFNQNVKGASFSWKLKDKWKLSLVNGIFIDRYSSLYKDMPLRTVNGTLEGCYQPPGYTGNFVTINDPQCGRPFTSLVSGARLEYDIRRDSSLGFNFSSSDDLLSTRRPADPGSSPLPASNRVGSVDTRWQLGTFRFSGEYAYSFTDFDNRLDSGCSTPLCVRNNGVQNDPGLGYQGDYGATMEASYRLHKLNLRTMYVRYMPNFASMNARQIPDLQDASWRASYDLVDWLTVDGTVRRSNDDLRHEKAFQTTIWGPEGRLIFHDLPFYRRGVFETGYRHRDLQASDGSVNRYVRMPYAEFTVPIATTFMTIGYERRETVDMIHLGQTTNVNRVYASLRGIYDFGGWHLSPSLRFELEREGKRPGLDYIPQGASVLDYLLWYDSNRLDTAAIYLEAPKWFILDSAFRASTATNTTLVDPISQPGLVSPAGYSRPSYRIALTYKIANDENKTLVFGFERYSNFYFDQTHVPTGGVINPLNFDERVSSLTFVYKFGKRGGR